MSEINLKNIQVENLTPEQRAKLQADLDRANNPDTSRSSEVSAKPDNLRVMPAPTKEGAPVPLSNQDLTGPQVVETLSSSEVVLGASDQKSLLTDVLQGKRSFDDLEVKPGSEWEITQQAINQKKAA